MALSASGRGRGQAGIAAVGVRSRLAGHLLGDAGRRHRPGGVGAERAGRRRRTRGWTRWTTCSELAPAGPGVGMLTAASVDRFVRAADGGVEAWRPSACASPPGPRPPRRPRPRARAPVCPGHDQHHRHRAGRHERRRPGQRGHDGDRGQVAGAGGDGFRVHGTASDAVCVAVRDHGPEELFGGPRSTWGARIARAVHTAVLQGAQAWAKRDFPGKPLSECDLSGPPDCSHDC